MGPASPSSRSAQWRRHLAELGDLDAAAPGQGRAVLSDRERRVQVVRGDQRVAAQPGARTAIADGGGRNARLAEVTWLAPYPDLFLEELPDASAGPEARYEAREAMALAFVTALQLLPPRQRAVLILRDVLDFPASEVAAMLDTTQQSVSSALKRARATLARELPSEGQEPPPAPGSAAEQELVARLVKAFEAADVDGIVALMTEDAWLRMPPVPLEYQGRELAGEFFATVAFRRGRRYRLVPTRANGQPAFAVYLRDPVNGVARVFGLFVVTLAGERISAITRFDSASVSSFGLPRTLTD
jgi:RNA polymerase sigma-70 factor, ECF subfamily